MSSATVDHSPVGTGGTTPTTQPDLAWGLAGLSAAAGLIHIAMTPIHGGSGLIDPLGFALVGLFQLLVAALILTGRAHRTLYIATIAVNAAVIGTWWWSRTYGMPVGSDRGIVESYGVVDVTTAVLELGIILLALRLVLGHEHRHSARVTPILLSVAALAVATVVITSPDAATHNHGNTATADQVALAKIQAERCDKDMNIPGYWKETKYLGVDTVYGGNPPVTSATPVSADGHNHGGTATAAGGSTTTTQPDPTGGRGSETLDQLIALTDKSAGGEGAAAALVVALGKASQEEYDNWLWWLRSSGTLTHSHAATSTAAPGDSGGHGGHAGPQAWTAITKQSDCDALNKEIATARAVALEYPTAADAEKAGWHRVTGYVPGIAAHFMNFGLVDDKFELTKPEMILYDGDGPTAHVVGLSYYLIHEGTTEPTQGFIGNNDHTHRHVGLCINNTGVIGDSTLTEAECAAIGGHKDNGSNAWMSHAWVVPGCESPWGVFSAASPLLDRELGRASGKNDGGCSASGVRERYGMDSPPETVDAQPASATPGN